MQKPFLLSAGRWAPLLLGGLLSLPATAGQARAVNPSANRQHLHLGTGQAEVWNTKGAGMNLRSGAGTGFPVLASLPDGTVVDVVGAMRNSFWQIKAGRITGWGRADFLRAHISNPVGDGEPNKLPQVPALSDGANTVRAGDPSSPVASSEPAAADPYAAALAQAKSATSTGEIDAASQVLSALLPSYPHDIDIPLQLGWLLFRRTRYTDALNSYQVALARSTPGSESELGVAWSLQRLGRCEEARSHFQAVLAQAGPESTATDGLRLCTVQPTLASAPASIPTPAPAPPTAPVPTPKLWVRPALAQSFFFYQSHPTISFVAAPLARLETLLYGRYYAAIAYRYSYFATHDGTKPWSQNDLYLDAGISGKSGGATLHYALIADGSGYSGTTHHVGLSARYSNGFDSLLNLTASVYSDAPVVRGELAFLLPIIGGFALRPGAALQWTPTELYKTLSLTASYYNRYVSLWLGGKVGDEKRPAYLDLTYVYNSPAVIPYGIWAGAAIRPGAKFTLTLGYSLDRLTRNDVTPVQDSVVNALTLGIAREF